MMFEQLYKKVMGKLEKELPNSLYYHGVHHTQDVINATDKIAKSEGVTDEEMVILKIAALFHDTGFCIKYNSNEIEGVNYALKELKKLDCSNFFIKTVIEIIESTEMQNSPVGRLQQIMSDADFDYFGRDDFHQISETLRMELNENGYNYSLKQGVEGNPGSQGYCHVGHYSPDSAWARAGTIPDVLQSTCACENGGQWKTKFAATAAARQLQRFCATRVKPCEVYGTFGTWIDPGVQLTTSRNCGSLFERAQSSEGTTAAGSVPH